MQSGAPLSRKIFHCQNIADIRQAAKNRLKSNRFNRLLLLVRSGKIT